MFTQDMVSRADGIFAPSGKFVLEQANTGIDDYCLPYLPASDIPTDFSDLSGDIGSAPMGHVELQPRPSPTNPDVKMIKGASPHSDDNIVGTHNRVGNITISNDIEIAVFIEVQCFHLSSFQ
jgi:hypothetical protein